MAVKFHFQTKVAFAQRRKLKKFISWIFEAEGRILDTLDIVFCSDDYLLKINQEFLDHDYFTDIISFDLTAAGREAIAAEIYISVERVAENAAAGGVPVATELNRVMFHGALHLCGYADKTSPEKKLMRAKEDYYLAAFSRSGDQLVSRGT